MSPSTATTPNAVDKRFISKMLGDAGVPPPIIQEVLENAALSQQLVAIIKEAQASGKPAGASTWAKVEAALAEHGMKRQRVDMGQLEMGPDGQLRPAQGQAPGLSLDLKEGEEALIREYLGFGGAPENLIRQVLGNKEMCEGALGVARKAQQGKK